MQRRLSCRGLRLCRRFFDCRFDGRFFYHRFRGGRLCAVHMLIGRGRGLGLARSRDNLDELIDAHFECANLFLKIHA
jgi:hypothetical protein